MKEQSGEGLTKLQDKEGRYEFMEIDEGVERKEPILDLDKRVAKKLDQNTYVGSVLSAIELDEFKKFISRYRGMEDRAEGSPRYHAGLYSSVFSVKEFLHNLEISFIKGLKEVRKYQKKLDRLKN